MPISFRLGACTGVGSEPGGRPGRPFFTPKVCFCATGLPVLVGLFAGGGGSGPRDAGAPSGLGNFALWDATGSEDSGAGRFFFKAKPGWFRGYSGIWEKIAPRGMRLQERERFYLGQ